MYLEHWSLEQPPFRSTSDPRGYFQGPVQEEAVARLNFLVEHRHPLALVAGPAGVGKSLLLDVFADALRRQGRHVVRVAAQGIDVRELWWSLAAELGLNPRPNETEPHLWRMISDRAAQHRSLARDLVVLLDDLDLAEPACASAVLRLLALNRRPESRVIVVATGRPESLGRLDGRLLEQAELRVELEPFSEADLGGYLTHAFQLAGRAESPFSNAAVSRLQELTGGIPRRVNHLAELALVAAASQEMTHVDTEIIDGAYHEMGGLELQRRAG